MSSASNAAPSADVELIKSRFEFHQDFPKKGIYFCDILPVLRDPLSFEILISHMTSHIFNHTLPKLIQGGQKSSSTSHERIDAIVGLDARGFLLGPIIAMRLGAAFVPVRKQGKLPGKCVQASYAKEYGTDVFEMQEGAVTKGSNVVVIDDLIATGGSAKAAGDLIKQAGGKTAEYIFVVGGSNLGGASKLDAPTYSIVDIEL